MAEGPDPGATGARHTRVDRPLVTLSAVVMIGAFVSALDATVVFVALDSIGHEFGAPLPSLQWVAVGYLLALAIVVPVTGWSVERFGARTMWLVALSLFTVGAALCGTAWSVESLIAFRVVQGLGGGMIPPLAQIILVRAAGPARIGRVMSMVSVPTQLAPIVGPTVGGFVIAGLGWRSAFYLYLPLGALAMLLAWWRLPNEPRRSAPRLDLVGLLLLSPGVVMLIYGLTMAGGGDVRLPGVGTLVAAAVGALLLAGYAVHALRRGRGAAIDLRLFRHRPFAVATGLIFLSGVSLFGLMFLLPLYFQQVRGSDPLQAGLLLAPQGVGMIAALLVAGFLVDRYGPRYIVLTGILITIAGTMPFTQVSTVDNDLLLTVALLVRGFGLGAAAIPLTAAAYRSLSEDEIPRAASALVIAQRLGASLGTAALAVILHRAIDAGTQEGAAPTLATLAGAFEHAFWWTVALSAVALAPAWLLPGRMHTTAPSSPAPTPDASSE
jgi:EmrB/QacA subfamily drug resistance transporter